MPELPRASVEITHPDGLNLRFAEHLASFLLNRPHPHAPFWLGHWLATLEDEALYHLEVLSSRAHQAPESLGEAIHDLLLVVVTATAAETRQQKLHFQEDGVITAFGCLWLACCLERFARAGWVVLTAPCSILPQEEQHIELTEAGRQQGQDWACQLKAMMH
ncbi:MAG: hypothetical protein U1F76_18205 [Candidatus Competibacteraceae bacterium]